MPKTLEDHFNLIKEKNQRRTKVEKEIIDLIIEHANSETVKRFREHERTLLPEEVQIPPHIETIYDSMGEWKNINKNYLYAGTNLSVELCHYLLQNNVCDYNTLFNLLLPPILDPTSINKI